MKTIRTIWLALMLGCIVEGVLIALGVFLFRIGPDGPAPGFSTVLFHIHSPGLTLAKLITSSPLPPLLDWPVLVIPTILVFAVIAYPLMFLIRKMQRKTTATDAAGIENSKAP